MVAFGLPPLLIWAYATPYFDRLAARAWPWLVLLSALALVPGLRVAARAGIAFGLLPLTVFAAAAWFGLGSLDGCTARSRRSTGLSAGPGSGTTRGR